MTSSQFESVVRSREALPRPRQLRIDFSSRRRGEAVCTGSFSKGVKGFLSLVVHYQVQFTHRAQLWTDERTRIGKLQFKSSNIFDDWTNGKTKRQK